MRRVLSPLLRMRLATAAPRPTLVRTKTSITDRVRSKLWGGDAPGPADPYTRTSLTPVEAAPEVDKSGYVPAVDARDLQIVGLDTPTGVWEVDTFAPLTPVRDTEAVHRAVHRAVVEVFTAGSDIQFSMYTPTGSEDATETVAVEVADSGEVKLVYPAGVQEAIVKALEPAEEAMEEDVIEMDAGEGAVAGEQGRPAWLEEGLKGEGWAKVPLNDDATKFAVSLREKSW